MPLPNTDSGAVWVLYVPRAFSGFVNRPINATFGQFAGSLPYCPSSDRNLEIWSPQEAQ
jgi:hypothetical protein